MFRSDPASSRLSGAAQVGACRHGMVGAARLSLARWVSGDVIRALSPAPRPQVHTAVCVPRVRAVLEEATGWDSEALAGGSLW